MSNKQKIVHTTTIRRNSDVTQPCFSCSK